MWVWDMAVGEIEGSGDGETFEAHVINTQVFFFFGCATWHMGS